jgi:hypothetical protein
MRAHKLNVFIPADHELVVSIPKEVPAGPAELIVLVETPAHHEPVPSFEEARTRFRELSARLAADPRPFRDLSLQERQARLRQVMGAGRGLLSTSEEFAQQKQRDIDLEAERFGR